MSISTRVNTMKTVADQLQEKISDQSCTVGVLGMGYVGLPLALAFAEAGYRVLGFDIDLAKVEAAIPLTGSGILDHTVNGRMTPPPGNRSPNRPAAPYGIYPCQGEDRWIAISVFTEDEWRSFARALGNPAWTEHSHFTDLTSRLLHQDELDGNVAEWTLDQYEAGYYDSLVADAARNPWRQPTRLHPRTVRGGAYDDPPGALRCAGRIESSLSWKRRDPQIPKSIWWNTDSPFVGFRLVRPAMRPSAEEREDFWSLVLGGIE